MKQKQNHTTSGFTLIEVTLSSVLLAAVIGAAAAFWYYVQRNYQFSITSFQLTDQASQTVRQIATEVRQAREAMNGAYPLAILDDNQLAFYADVNQDGIVERRRYYAEGNMIKRGIIEPSGDPPSYDLGAERTTIIVDQVDTEKLPLFTYYNGSWPGDTTHNPLSYWERPLETRLIKIFIPLKITSDTDTHAYQTESIVQIRNLKNN